MEPPNQKQHDLMNEILNKNGDVIEQIFENIFGTNELEFSQQLILSFNTFSSAIEAFADSIQASGVQGCNFEKMIIGIKRSYEINKDERTKEKVEELPKNI
ncbi:MAG: hypothetical protein QXF82_07900 [Nitrososphaeria archaeon]